VRQRVVGSARMLATAQRPHSRKNCPAQQSQLAVPWAAQTSPPLSSSTGWEILSAYLPPKAHSTLCPCFQLPKSLLLNTEHQHPRIGVYFGDGAQGESVENNEQSARYRASVKQGSPPAGSRATVKICAKLQSVTKPWLVEMLPEMAMPSRRTCVVRNSSVSLQIVSKIPSIKAPDSMTAHVTMSRSRVRGRRAIGDGTQASE